MKAILLAINIFCGVVGFISDAAAEPRFVSLIYSTPVNNDDYKGTLQIVKMEEQVSESATSKIFVPFHEFRLIENSSNSVHSIRTDGFPSLPSNAQIWFNKDSQIFDQKLNLYCLPEGLKPALTPPGDSLRLSADQAASAVHAVAQVTVYPAKKHIYLDQLNKICDNILETNARNSMAKSEDVDPAELVNRLKPQNRIKGNASVYEAQLSESELKPDRAQTKPEVTSGSHMIGPVGAGKASASAITSQ